MDKKELKLLKEQNELIRKLVKGIRGHKSGKSLYKIRLIINYPILTEAFTFFGV